MVESEVNVRTYEPSDQREVIEIFSYGMTEMIPKLVFKIRYVDTPLLMVAQTLIIYLLTRSIYWSTLVPMAIAVYVLAAAPSLSKKAIDEYTKQSVESDLADIPTFYLKEGSHFWVATLPVPGSPTKRKVVGHAALEKKENGSAEVRRVSVAPGCRGKRVASMLMDALESFAVESGYTHLFLTTSSVQTEAVTMYSKRGMKVTKTFRPIWYSTVYVNQFEKNIGCQANVPCTGTASFKSKCL